jgi:hypothetical protein
LAAGGGERSVPNILESFLFSLMLGLNSGRRGGGVSASSERDQKLLQMLGLYVSQQCQYALVSLKAMPEQ